MLVVAEQDISSSELSLPYPRLNESEPTIFSTAFFFRVDVPVYLHAQFRLDCRHTTSHSDHLSHSRQVHRPLVGFSEEALKGHRH